MMWWLVTLVAPALGASGTLTYEQALREALEANPALQRAQLERTSAEAGVLGSQGIFDPTLEVNGNWRQSQTKGFFQGFPFDSRTRNWNLDTSLSQSLGSGTSYSLNTSLDRNFSSFITDFGLGQTNEQIQDVYTSNVNVSVTQQLLRGLRMSFNLQNVTRARQALGRAELQLERTRQDTLSQVATAYWGWVYRVQLASIAEQSLSVAEEALRVGRLQLETGQIAPVEATRLEAALVQAQGEAMDASIAAQQAADDLALLIGRPPGALDSPATPVEDPSVLELDPEAAVGVALQQNLELALARAEAEFAEVDRLNARHGRLPSLAATAAAGVGAQGDTAGASVRGLTQEEAFPFYSVGGRFSVPLGNRAARGDEAQASARLAIEQRSVGELERSVSAQVRQQVRTLASSRQRIQLADANHRLAKQTLAAEEALAAAGRSIQRVVLEARAEVARTAAEAARARTDYKLAQTELLRLQGQLDAR